jgi:hypothetical protein
VNGDMALLLSTSYLTASFLSRKFRTEFANEAPFPKHEKLRVKNSRQRQAAMIPSILLILSFLFGGDIFPA